MVNVIVVRILDIALRFCLKKAIVPVRVQCTYICSTFVSLSVQTVCPTWWYIELMLDTVSVLWRGKKS